VEFSTSGEIPELEEAFGWKTVFAVEGIAVRIARRPRPPRTRATAARTITR
jgi:hypothetical protein